MPYLNDDGHVTHGVGGGQASVDNVPFSPGGVMGWVDPFVVAFVNGATNWTVAHYDTRSRVITPIGGQANHGYAGGGHSAWFLATSDASRGLYATTGFRSVDAGLVGMGPDGAICYKPQYHSNGPTHVRELDGADWRLTESVPAFVHLLGQQQAVWTSYQNTVVPINVPQPVYTNDGGLWKFMAAQAGGRWWGAYYSGTHGVVLHPFDSYLGYAIAPQGDAWHTIHEFDGYLRVAISVGEAEQAGQLWMRDYDVVTNRMRNPWGDPATGGNAWVPATLVDVRTINAVDPPDPPDPPDPEDDMKPPIVTVDTWTLDDVLDGREIVFHDAGNPELHISARVWVQGGSMYASVTHKGGFAQTGATRTVHPCSEGEPVDPPIEPPVDPPARQQVGFGSNLGAVDLTQLATSDAWTDSRTRISAMQLYVGHVNAIGAHFVTPNAWPATAELVRNLHAWGILLELQMGFGETVNDVAACANTIAGAGGQLGAICFDHGFHETSPEAWATRLHQIHARYPALIVGAYVPYPFKSIAEIRARVQAWADLDALPAFLRLDCDYNQRDTYTAATHRSLRAICDQHRLNLHCTINAQEHISDVEWVRQGKAWFDRAVSLGRWDAMMVQSWASTPSDTERTLPHNLPESDPSAHTHLLRYVLEGFPNVEPPPIEPPAKTTAIQTSWGTFWGVADDGTIVAGDDAQPFEVVAVDSTYLALKDPITGLYVCAENEGRDNVLIANRDAIAGWEMFERHPGEQAGTVALKAVNGKFVCAEGDGRVVVNRERIGPQESFTATLPSDRPPITGPITANAGRVFYDDHGAPWRYMGVSAFPLCRLFSDGYDIQPFLDVFPGYNVLRVWDYVPWPNTGWQSCSVDQWRAFLSFVGAQGWRVELTLLTDDDPSRLAPADRLVRGLSGTNNLLVEIGNEPQTNKNIDTTKLRSACEASGLLYTSGNYEQNEKWFGRYGVAHTPRDDEWPRKGHDLLEYYNGGGPSKPSDVACKAPWVGDEPIRPDQATTSYGKVKDYRAYGGVCALLGAGCTFHFAGGRFGQLPTVVLAKDRKPRDFPTLFAGGEDSQCAAAMLEGLVAFDPDAPNWSYRRLDERGGSLRTYVLGERCMVRVRPTQPNPEAGWTPRDPDGILWTK